MKRLILVLFVCLFIACNNNDIGVEIPFDDKYKFAETELSVLEVMSMAEYWRAPSEEIQYYTEPNGQGECFYPNDIALGGVPLDIFSVSMGNLRFYHLETSVPQVLPSYYYDLPATIEGDMILFKNIVGDDYYFKILDYDETKILVESNYVSTTRAGLEYPYSIFVLQKGYSTTSDWKDRYVSYEEYLKAIEEWENRK